MSNKRKLVYKYTVKMPDTGNIDTHYVLGYSEELAKNGLAEFLKIEPTILRFSIKTIPWKVRAIIFDKNNDSINLTLDVKTKPSKEISIEERKANAFDLRASKLQSLKYKVRALAKHDKELLLDYANLDVNILKQFSGYSADYVADYFTYGRDAFKTAFNNILFEIEQNDFQREKIKGVNILDILMSIKPMSMYN